MRDRLIGLSILLSLSCSASSGGSANPSYGGASGSGGSSAGGTGALGTGGGGGLGATGGVLLDAGGDRPPGEGCTAVDVLFVIDNSTSMRNNQEALAQQFPKFVDAMLQNLPPATDLHVGITTSSFYAGPDGSPGETNCASNGTTQEFLQHYTTPDQSSTGENGGQGRLYTHDGKAFFAMNTADDPSALQTWFTGAATGPGERGSVWEMVAAGGAYIAHPANAQANTGFIRDAGAVLVVFFLTDEVDNSPETVAEYHDLLVTAKSACGGDACIVAGGIIPPCIATTPGNTLFGLMSSFGETPSYADIDAPAQYSQSLGAALAQVIALTCENIPPPR